MTLFLLLLMVQKSKTTTMGFIKPIVNNIVINYQPTSSSTSTAFILDQYNYPTISNGVVFIPFWWFSPVISVKTHPNQPSTWHGEPTTAIPTETNETNRPLQVAGVHWHEARLAQSLAFLAAQVVGIRWFSRWWFQRFLEFSPLFGEDSHFY